MILGGIVSEIRTVHRERRPRWVRVLVGSMLAGITLGCSGANWLKVDVESGYQPPKVVKVAIIGARRWPEAAKVFQDALLEELDSQGVRALVVADSTGKPDVDLEIVRWDPGSRGTRYLGSYGAGEGEILVEVNSLGIDGAARGWIAAGFFGGSADGAVESVAVLIADTIATGKTPENSPQKHAEGPVEKY